jgi:hypothetical protein
MASVACRRPAAERSATYTRARTRQCRASSSPIFLTHPTTTTSHALTAGVGVAGRGEGKIGKDVGPRGKAQASSGIERRSWLGLTYSELRAGSARRAARVRSGVAWRGRACKGGRGWQGMLRGVRGPLRPGRPSKRWGVGGHGGRHLVSFCAG